MLTSRRFLISAGLGALYAFVRSMGLVGPPFAGLLPWIGAWLEGWLLIWLLLLFGSGVQRVFRGPADNPADSERRDDG